jgi:hypothetical protein
VTTTKEREARSVLKLAKDRERGQARIGALRPQAGRPPRARPTPEAQAAFVRRVRSYLDVPRG